MIPGEQLPQLNSIPRPKLQIRKLLDLTNPENISAVLAAKKEYSSENDYRKFVSGFVDEALGRLPEGTHLLYSPIIFESNLIVQFLSFVWEEQRYYKLGVNYLVTEFSETELNESQLQLKEIEGFTTFAVILSGGALDQVEQSFIKKIGEIKSLVNGEISEQNDVEDKEVGIFALARRLGTGKLREIFRSLGITSSAQNQESQEK